MSEPLHQLCDEPRPMPLAGQTWTVYRLRLRDLAALEEWAAGLGPHPLSLLFEGDPGSREWRRRLRDAYAACKWGVPPGQLLSDGLRDALEDEEGRWRAMHRILLRGHPGLEWPDICALADRCAAIGAEAGREEAAIGWHAWGTDAAQVLDAIIYGRPPRDEGGTLDWGGIAYELAERAGGLHRVPDLTLPQYAALCRRGKPWLPGPRIPPGRDREFRRARKEREREWFGDLDGPGAEG